MEIDPSEGERSKEAIFLSQITTNSPLPSSVSKLSGSSRGIPYEKDFHFYNNFSEFKNPVKEIDEKSKTILERIGTSSQLWGKPQEYPSGLVIDDFDGYDWLVNINDDVLEKLDASLDEFKAAREADSGFQVVQGRKNKRGVHNGGDGGLKGMDGLVQVAAKPKAKIPFHIPSIPRPQDEYKIIVNNVNQPFEHVWLQRSEDGTRFIHPLENYSVLDFVDKSINISPKKPDPLQSTPFKLVEDVKDLKHLANKLKSVDEFAVDLEHNQYRSFQGLTCLMQISTRTEDFVIDTLRLRIHVGPYLREAFKDPTKRKVMHGADRDILWLQRDFGIYVCNLFDTGQASRVLKLERFSLEYLLHYFCGVTANKEYQNADWRLRPLPPEMVRYARDDTHYLLYIYDLMRMRLLSASADPESADPPLVEVYKRSYDICMQLYEKELLTESSYLHIYGLQDAGLNAQQLAVVAGLCEWRDVVARAEDESTGFVLPNKTLLDIAKNMPLNPSSLRRSLKSKHPYVERNLGSVLSIIRHSMQNAAVFEKAAEQLKERYAERGVENSSVTDASEVLPYETSELWGTVAEAENVIVNKKTTSGHSPTYLHKQNKLLELGSMTSRINANQQAFPEHPRESGSTNDETKSCNITPRVAEFSGETGATVQVQKKPNRAFGALLGGPGKRKTHSYKKEDLKLEHIKASVNLPFHSFHSSEEGEQAVVEQSGRSLNESGKGEPPVINGSGAEEDYISLKSSCDVEASVPAAAAENDENVEKSKEDEVSTCIDIEDDDDDGEQTLSDLSSSFQKLTPLNNNNKRATNKWQESTECLQLKPFDYEATKEQVIFGKDDGQASGNSRNRLVDKADKKNGSVTGHSQRSSGDLPQGRRRQAFPASGNRSATFR